jgi:hypothetical protein
VQVSGSYRAPRRRRGSGNAFTHAIMAVLGAALATALLLAFYSPGSAALPGGGAVPSPATSTAPLTGGEQGIMAKVKPGLVLIRG